MDDRYEVSIELRITGLVQTMLAERGLAAPVKASDDLRACGLSSLDMVKLVLAVEAEFDFIVAEEDMIPANFRTIDAVGAMVAQSLARI